MSHSPLDLHGLLQGLSNMLSLVSVLTNRYFLSIPVISDHLFWIERELKFLHVRTWKKKKVILHKSHHFTNAQLTILCLEAVEDVIIFLKREQWIFVWTKIRTADMLSTLPLCTLFGVPECCLCVSDSPLLQLSNQSANFREIGICVMPLEVIQTSHFFQGPKFSNNIMGSSRPYKVEAIPATWTWNREMTCENRSSENNSNP
jgi:hypothetical protein